MAQDADATEKMVDFLELLIELAGLEKLRHSWAKEATKDSQWRMKFDILNEMIQRRLEVREQYLRECQLEFPELKDLDFTHGSSGRPHYDA